MPGFQEDMCQSHRALCGEAGPWGTRGYCETSMPVGFEVMLKGVGDRGAVPVLALGRTLLVCVSTHTAPCHP